MFLKSYVLLLLLGLSLAFPQEEVKEAVVQNENADPKVETTASPLEEEDPVTELTEQEIGSAGREAVEEEFTDEEQLEEGVNARIAGEYYDGEEILDEEIVPEDEFEYTCEYTDSTQTAFKITFIKDAEGIEEALEIDPPETENIDEKLIECLQQDLVGRRNVKRRRRRPVRRGSGKRKGTKRRKGGKRRGGSSAIILKELRRRIRGNPKSVTVREMRDAIRLAQRFVAAKGKEERRRKLLRKKAMNKKRRKAQKKRANK